MPASTECMYTTDFCSKYNVRFHRDVIKVTVTHSDDEVNKWIDKTLRLHHEPLFTPVGLGIKCCTGVNEHSSRGPVTLLILCVQNRCLIIQFCFRQKQIIPPPLQDFLNNEDFKFVGFGIRDDVAKLDNDYSVKVQEDKMLPSNINNYIIDLQTLAREKIGETFSNFADMASTVLSVKKRIVTTVLKNDIKEPQNITRSEWDKRLLTLPQVQYACLNAFLFLKSLSL